jgi:hypothetical protein
VRVANHLPSCIEDFFHSAATSWLGDARHAFATWLAPRVGSDVCVFCVCACTARASVEQSPQVGHQMDSEKSSDAPSRRTCKLMAKNIPQEIPIKVRSSSLHYSLHVGTLNTIRESFVCAFRFDAFFCAGCEGSLCEVWRRYYHVPLVCFIFLHLVSHFTVCPLLWFCVLYVSSLIVPASLTDTVLAVLLR